jgi:transposase
VTCLWMKSHAFGTKDIAERASWDVALLAPSGDRILSQIEQGPAGGWRSGGYENSIWSFTSAACGTLGGVEVAGVGCDVGAAGADPGRPAAPLPLPGPRSLQPARLFGGDPVRALHRHALVAGALQRAWPAERRDLPAPDGGVVSPWPLPTSDPGAAGAAGGGGQAGLVAGDRRCLAGRGKKGGEKVARTLRGTPGSRFHLVVEAGGLPLEVLLGPGNENERRYLLPLLDALAAAGIQPSELWADRGYASRAHEQALSERQIQSRISQPRRAGDPIPPNTPTREVWRGKKRRVKTPDPQARHRWPVERTNAWLKALRRIATRRDRKADNYLAFLHLGMIVILTRAF